MNIPYKTILISPDKFKGSLTAKEFCQIVESCIKKKDKNINILSAPLADGGEGSLNCFIENTGASTISKSFTNANFEKVISKYAIKNDVAFIELAQTSGLINTKIKNPCLTTTLGVGEQIKDAINNGAKTIYLAMGGSSTNDAGCGMACALGFKFFNKFNETFIPTGGTLNEIVKIVPPSTSINANIIALCDVKNVLYGKKGATYVYAKQKGATKKQIKTLDSNLKHFNVVSKNLGFDFKNVLGGGSAGGVGAGAILFLNAKLQSGIETIFKLVNIEEKICDADLVISGEGKIDTQSKYGKVVFSLYNKCKNKKFVAFCGVNKLKRCSFPIIEINCKNETLLESIKNTKTNLTKAVDNFLNEML